MGGGGGGVCVLPGSRGTDRSRYKAMADSRTCSRQGRGVEGGGRIGGQTVLSSLSHPATSHLQASSLL